MSSFDILIIGGGIVGNAIALSLCKDGYEVGLLDVAPPLAHPGSELHHRVCSINLQSSAFLNELGVWTQIEAIRATPFSAIKVWDASSRGELKFEAADCGLDNLGHIVENDIIVYSLEQSLVLESGFTRLSSASLISIEQNTPDQITICTLDDRQYSAALVVGADGAHSTVRSLNNISVNNLSYQQHGIVTWVNTSQPHQNIARQVFLPGGPLALLPLSERHCSIVWSVPSEQVEEICLQNDEDFNRTINHAFGDQLGEISVEAKRLSFPLARSHAKSYLAERVVLIGDAAHTVHPLAGLGANQGLADVIQLKDTLATIKSKGKPIYSRRELRSFERKRKAENQLALATMDAFHFGFTSSNALVTQLRGTGLGLAQASDTIKSFFIQQATAH
ncbi:MAG: 2-octaprenylphenol hydroxylase [Parasphingorhabdus sp.]